MPKRQRTLYEPEKIDLSNVRLVGYARVSDREQHLNLQLDALEKIGVLPDNLHVEKVSGASKKRWHMDLAIKDLQPGDTFIVWRVDRVARNVRWHGGDESARQACRPTGGNDTGPAQEGRERLA